jgi:hypothetical protein
MDAAGILFYVYIKAMKRLLLLLCLFALSASAAQYRLYLKEGGFHSVREHQVLADRVRYYSTERGDWEEIPTEMVDLKKTEKELAARSELLAEEKKLSNEEIAAEREMRRIIASIPEDPGVFYLTAENKMARIKIAESTIVTDKKRQILKLLSPVPLVAGKSTIELAGEKSANSFSEKRPEFYMRLSKPQQFALVQLTPTKKGARMVETVQVLPVAKDQKFEERKELEIFRQQLGEGLFKLWPQNDLAPGEYAWIEFTEGEVNLQIWDFRIP